MKDERREVVRRVDAAAVRQRRSAVAPDQTRARPAVAVVDLEVVRRAVRVLLQFEPTERQHQRLATTASSSSFTNQRATRRDPEK